jgi:two-component system alkaline phosphatase synthesis response regulator PhoP
VTRVLVVEDNADLAFGLRATLEFEGYRVSVAEDGEEGLRQALEDEHDLILLDLMLPELGGYEVLKRLRRAGRRTPVLILTARGEEHDVLMGFDGGADDYVTKPFSTLELLARIRALLRRAGPSGEDEAVEAGHVFRFGGVEVDARSRTVVRDSREVALTPKEFDLLLALVRREGAVAQRSELLGEVWGYANTDVPTRTIDIHVAELRKKLEEDPSNPRHLLTVRKVGYRLQT